jgi:hypothetical protein
MDRLKAKEILERDYEAEDEAVDEVEANVLVEDVEVNTHSLEEISTFEATSIEQTTAEVVESIQNILEQIVQSGLVKNGNSLVDVVIDQKELTTPKVQSLQLKMNKHAKKRLSVKENNGASAKKIKSFVLNENTNLYENE